MEQAQPTRLIEAARMHCRSFAPAWMFPVLFFFGGIMSEELGHQFFFFWFVSMPLFFWTFFRASRPWLEQKVRYGHFVLLAMVLPFLIWVVAVFSANLLKIDSSTSSAYTYQK